MDLACVAATLPVTIPVMAGIAAVTWAIQGTPILFRQQRPGLHGRPFTIYKFRTMREPREGGPQSDTERLTGFGRFLRGTSLDELPELFNVLKGDMSLVGPRPLLMKYLQHYTPELHRRHDVLPGITGWAQVNGRNTVDWGRRFAFDLWYVDHQSVILDMKILLLTAWKVLTRDGIVEPGSSSSTEDFNGLHGGQRHEAERCANQLSPKG
jgi:sugar transferase EpsL